MEAIFSRHSVRKFLPKPVEKEKLERLLQAAMAAPSAGNQHPWEFYVVQESDVLQRLATCSPYAGCCAQAPAAIVVCKRDKLVRFPGFANLDLSACTENILIEASYLGLGGVWLALAPYKARMKATARTLQTAADSIPFAIVPIGYEAEPKATVESRYDETRIHWL